MSKTTHDGIPIVDVVTPELMYGNTPLEKELNAYITCAFIMSKGVPADECIYEARRILVFTDKSEAYIAKYLRTQFADPRDCLEDARKIIEIIKKHAPVA